MIPIQLTIQGLYSYQEKQTIDFTKLTAANLFGIFGSVGSGKSSILEAITFAIYGKTDRLNLSGDNRNYNMMNLKSDELLIDFIFETGKAQTAYRAVVKGRRNSKNFDDVKKLDRLAYERNGKEWQPIEPRALESAIGLSYDNFKRTIIIPQGQFQEFLQLGNKDRTQMMKELFGLERFELYYKVTALESKNNARKQHLEGQLQQLGAIDPEQVKQYQQQQDDVEKAMKAQILELAQLQKQEVEWKQLQELTKKLSEAGNVLKQLQAQEPEFQQLEKSITNYEQCVIQFKHLLESLQLSSKSITQKAAQIKQDAEKLKLEETAIDKVEKALADLKPSYDKRDELKQKADELGRLMKIKELVKKVETDKDRLEKGAKIWQQTTDQIEKLKSDRLKLEGLLKTEKAKLPDLAALAHAKSWHVEWQNMERQQLELEKDIRRYQEEEKSIQQELQKYYQLPVFADLPEQADQSAAVKYLREKIEAIKKQLKAIEKEADSLRLKAQLKAFAAGLQEGTPCPLCGAEHHPEVYSAASSHDQQQNLQNARQKHEQEIEQINEQTSRMNELDSQQKFNQRYLKEWVVKKEEGQKKIKEHQALFKWEKYKEVQDVEKALGESGRIQNFIKKKEGELEQLVKVMDKASNDKERFQFEIEKIKTALAVGQTELKSLKDQLKMIVLEDYQFKTTDEISAKQQKLLQQQVQLEKQFEAYSNALTEHRKLKDTLTGGLTANRKVMEQEQEANQKLTVQLRAQLEKSDFQSLDEVSQILAHPMALEQEKQKLSTFKDKQTLTKNQLAQLQKEIGDRRYDLEVHQKLLAEIKTIGEWVNQKNQDLGKVSELLQKLKKDLENQATLHKEMSALELRGDNIRTMKSLFKGSGFVNYISSVYLQNLCNAANDRFFQLTRQKLSLEITSENNFQVRDFMNGGKVRSVKTLSGGQTFQAALSLALALADNIQKITESNQNFFFLDEGFGSLDKESLAVVFDTLKSLRKENRTVGVISHVEEMQQEIDVHLRIDNQEEKGSLIHASWKA
ncbi:SbcC/MukB-like Walker B domain-containing protein [Sunxiuqinia sp. sy24]|uniref:SbcC/MukB-like Walker B domain-containing protein n=1 Tax=Sunxiuqinia sp. sy24 TaxID=3461495 RepID=UPI0040454871